LRHYYQFVEQILLPQDIRLLPAIGQLLTGVETVAEGIYELVSKQQDHWGSIKVMN
jgi:hypothetical protein